jgi:tetratricopeptide (TPR) repeat protein
MNIAHRTLAMSVRGTDCSRGMASLAIAAALASLALLAALGAGPPTAMSAPAVGGSRAIPSQAYFNHFALLYGGEYEEAYKEFKLDLSSGVKTAQTRWIDSICYYTMVGECYYRMGKLADALDSYTAAIKLYLAFPNWMQQVQFPAVIQGKANNLSFPWGRSSRGTKLGIFPEKITLAQGQLTIEPQLQQGGVVTPPSLTPVNVQELVRCTALAIKRRGEIMGPVSQHDPLTNDISLALGRRPGPANHWSAAWIDLELGIAYAAGGQAAQAIPLLKQSLVVSGEFDHPLTAMGLLELGRIALDAGNYPEAGKCFEEATYAAMAYNDYTTLEEAFRYGALTHIVSGQPGLYPPLAAATTWARNKNRELHASLLLSAAENNALLNQTNAAAAALGEAKSSMGTRTIGKIGEAASRLHYLAALIDFQLGKTTLGDQEIEQALNLQREASKWLFQIRLGDYFVTGHDGPHLNAHRALDLYARLLGDPTPADWLSRPLESLSVLSTPHAAVYEHWFEDTLDSGMELGLEVADRTRRHRFYSTLPLGGRLLSLRWVLESPIAGLDKQAQLERQSLLTKFPKYDELAKQVRKLRDELAAAPLVAEAPAAQRKQADTLAEISKLSAQQETLLREIALRREAADMVFPPQYATKDVQASLAPRQLMLIFFTTANSTHAWLISKERYASWKTEAPAMLEKKIAGLLKALGNYDSIREVQQTQLVEETWRQAARDLTDGLVSNSKAGGTKVNLSDNIDELIVVPDGPLWYLPFECLQVAPAGADPKKRSRDGKELVPLISKSRVRYLPTMGLAMPERINRRPTQEIGFVLGKLFPRDDSSVAENEFGQLKNALPHAWPIKGALPAASPVYGSLFDSLVVFDDIAAAKKGPYDWSPMQMDRAEAAGALSQWFALPWKSPLAIVLPGFHTPAETALRGTPSAGAGNEMFLSICGLMSTGTRTLLISRWRTGGASSYELLRQFLQELPYASAADAWQRSVQVTMDTPLDFNREPRVKKSTGGEGMTGRHPFFWSGYLLVDTGWAPPKAEKPVAGPAAINLNAKAGAAAAPAPKN